jgi:hypothetical protein
LSTNSRCPTLPLDPQASAAPTMRTNAQDALAAPDGSQQTPCSSTTQRTRQAVDTHTHDACIHRRKLLDRRTTRTWTQLTHAHKRYARSRTTPERDQASGHACDGFIPNNRLGRAPAAPMPQRATKPGHRAPPHRAIHVAVEPAATPSAEPRRCPVSAAALFLRCRPCLHLTAPSSARRDRDSELCRQTPTRRPPEPATAAFPVSYSAAPSFSFPDELHHRRLPQLLHTAEAPPPPRHFQ